MIDTILPNLVHPGMQQSAISENNARGFDQFLGQHFQGQTGNAGAGNGLSDSLKTALMGLQTTTADSTAVNSSTEPSLQQLNITELLNLISNDDMDPRLALFNTLLDNRFMEKELEVVRHAIMGQLTPIVGAEMSDTTIAHNQVLADNILQTLAFSSVGVRPVSISHVPGDLNQGNQEIVSDTNPGNAVIFDSRLPLNNEFAEQVNASLDMRQNQTPGNWSLPQTIVGSVPFVQTVNVVPHTDAAARGLAPVNTQATSAIVVSVGVGQKPLVTPLDITNSPTPGEWSLAQASITGVPSAATVNEAPLSGSAMSGVRPINTIVSSAIVVPAESGGTQSTRHLTLASTIYPLASISAPFMSNVPELSLQTHIGNVQQTLSATVQKDSSRFSEVALRPQRFNSLIQKEQIQPVSGSAVTIKLDTDDRQVTRFNHNISTVLSHDIPKWFFMVLPSSSAQTLWYRNYKLDDKTSEQLLERLLNSELVNQQNINRIVINGKQAWLQDVKGETHD